MVITKKITTLQLFIRLTLFLSIWLFPLWASAQEVSKPELLRQLLGGMVSSSSASFSYVPVPVESPRFSLTKEGFLRNLGAPPNHYFPVAMVIKDDPEKTAKNFLKEHAHLFGAANSKVDFRVIKSRQKHSRRYVRFEHRYADLPVFGSQVIIQLNDLGGVEYCLSDILRNTRALDEETISLMPRLSADDAVLRAHTHVFKGPRQYHIATTPPVLTIFDPSVLGTTGPIRLVWDLTISFEEDPFIGGRFLIDSQTAEIVRHYPLNISALDRDIYDANNTRNTDPGTLSRSEGGNPSTIGDVNDAYNFVGDAYNFYNTQHGRDSLDNSGMTLSVTVRYCSNDLNEACPYQNAFFWEYNDRLYFGDGWAVDDVVGHEYTHGVTHFESQLIYENHSGAISESFSDIWGEFIDLGNGAGTDTQTVRWQLGEDLANGANRDMADPPTFNDPDRLNHPSFVPPTANPNDTNDHGGVHTNCGVNNKLAYLITDGDAFRGWTIDGLGINRVADLYYEVNTNLLSSGADYTDLYHSLRQAAVNLGWTTSERNNLYRACLAVEIADVGRDIYVNRANTGYEDGSQAHPYNSLYEGKNTMAPGDILNLYLGSYTETPTFDRMGTIKAWGGAVLIGVH